MTLTVSPTLPQVFADIRAFLLSIVPAGTIVLKGPVNRAAQPAVDHIVVTPTYRKRLRTNEYTDDPINQTTAMEEGVQLDAQIDCYGGTLAPDWATMIETVFRSEYATQALTTCQPLYADDARQIPLTTGEEQYLQRWMVRAVLQYNPVTTTVQQSATALSVTTVNVDEAYPPA